MTTVQEIEDAISRLPPGELATFTAWFETYTSARFDDRIARDAEAGRLDAMAAEALADFGQGHVRPL